MSICVVIHRVGYNGSVHIFSAERCTIWFLTEITLIKVISNFLSLYTNTIYNTLSIVCQIFPCQRSSFESTCFAGFSVLVMHISQTHLYFYSFYLKFPFSFLFHISFCPVCVVSFSDLIVSWHGKVLVRGHFKKCKRRTQLRNQIKHFISFAFQASIKYFFYHKKKIQGLSQWKLFSVPL